MEVSYNLLLGRPWIHVAKAVPFTLYQVVKFEWDRQEIVIQGEDNTCTINDAIVPFIETDDDKGPWVYQVFDVVLVYKVPEGENIPLPRIAVATFMIASEMLNNGFVPEKGLGVDLQGIVQPVSLPKNLDTFGIGFKLTAADVRRARKLKKRVRVLPKPIPRLFRSFVRPSIKKQLLSKVTGPLIGADRDLNEGFERLFAEINMVEAGERSSKADIQFVGPKAKVNNWMTTPLPIRREPCSLYTGSNDMACTMDLQPSLKNRSDSELIVQEVDHDDELEYDGDEAFEEINRELSQFEEKYKPNLNDTEAVNLGDADDVKETKISIHIEPNIREELIKTLLEFKDIFAWSYDDMPGLSTDLVVHKLPIDPACPPVKQKLRRFKTDMSLKIKEEVTKQLNAKVIWVTRYPDWLANVVLVPKKDGKIRNAGSTYIRAMTTVFHDMIHKEIEVYVDDVIIKSKHQADHVGDLRKFFQRLRRYDIKLNPAKCVFGVPSGKLLGFKVSRRGIELDPSKIKSIQELPPPKNKTEVMSC
ncbi:uncharacterized protein [Nicotiana sylvestris]|uniref:uncharacterized protein n=1 Tax=Nicotiana sylvestris TaxID=4096 RepID=UPI00388C3DFD